MEESARKRTARRRLKNVRCFGVDLVDEPAVGRTLIVVKRVRPAAAENDRDDDRGIIVERAGEPSERKRAARWEYARAVAKHLAEKITEKG